MASPVPRDSVLAVEECLATITVDAMTPLPSDDDISSIPSPISSPDLPDIDEFLEYHKRLRSARDSSPSSLPNSSLPSSPVPDDNISMEGDFSSGRVHLYYKVCLCTSLLNHPLTYLTTIGRRRSSVFRDTLDEWIFLPPQLQNVCQAEPNHYAPARGIRRHDGRLRQSTTVCLLAAIYLGLLFNREGKRGG
jgi:hypothetical protein